MCVGPVFNTGLAAPAELDGWRALVRDALRETALAYHSIYAGGGRVSTVKRHWQFDRLTADELRGRAGLASKY